MFAAYCQKPHSDDPMAGLALGDRPEPKIPEGWVRVKVSHASLNRHDIFTLRGITSHAEGITYIRSDDEPHNEPADQLYPPCQRKRYPSRKLTHCSVWHTLSFGNLVASACWVDSSKVPGKCHVCLHS